MNPDLYKKLAEMPALRHKPEGVEEFRLDQSEVIAWMIANIDPLELAGQAWFSLRNQGAIIYNRETKTYRGGTVEEYEADMKVKEADGEAEEKELYENLRLLVAKGASRTKIQKKLKIGWRRVKILMDEIAREGQP